MVLFFLNLYCYGWHFKILNDIPNRVLYSLSLSLSLSLSVKAIRNRSQSAREQSKQRVYQRLAEMAEQLDAIDEVSKHMEDDFKNTKLVSIKNSHMRLQDKYVLIWYYIIRDRWKYCIINFQKDDFQQFFFLVNQALQMDLVCYFHT